MARSLKSVLIVDAAALVFCAATVLLRPAAPSPGGANVRHARTHDKLDEKAESASNASSPAKKRNPDAKRSRPPKDKPAKSPEERKKEESDVCEMRHEAEDMLRRFRGTPEERQEVIDECRAGKELILAIADLAVGEYDSMSPEDLEKAREEFEKEYRAELNYLQSGKLQRMLKTPEEQEVIGSAIEAVQQFLETLDNALSSAGY